MAGEWESERYGPNGPPHPQAGDPGPWVNGGGRDRKARVAEYLARRIQGAAITKHVADNFLIHGWFDHGESIMVFGPSGSAKSFLLIDMCLHLAALASWHGAAVTLSVGRVVYHISEGRKEGFENRVAAWCEEHPEIAAAALANFEVIPVRSDFHGSDDAECLAEALAQDPGPVMLIVIDTMAANMGEGDESTSRDISRVYANVAILQGITGAAVALVHHTGKDAKRGARGSSNIRAGLDVSIEVARNSDTVITATADKQRERPDGLEFSFKLKSVYLGTTPRGFDTTTVVIEPVTKQEKAEAKDKTKVGALRGQKLIAFEALQQASAASPRRGNPADYPAGHPLVNAREWREVFKRRAYPGQRPKADTLRKAWLTAMRALLNAGLVCEHNELFWLVPKAGGGM